MIDRGQILKPHIIVLLTFYSNSFSAKYILHQNNALQILMNQPQVLIH